MAAVGREASGWVARRFTHLPLDQHERKVGGAVLVAAAQTAASNCAKSGGRQRRRVPGGRWASLIEMPRGRKHSAAAFQSHLKSRWIFLSFNASDSETSLLFICGGLKQKQEV